MYFRVYHSLLAAEIENPMIETLRNDALSMDQHSAMFWALLIAMVRFCCCLQEAVELWRCFQPCI